MVAEMLVAAVQLYRVCADEWPEGGVQLVARFIQSGSRTTYISATWQFLLHCNNNGIVLGALDTHMQSLAWRKRGGSVARGLMAPLKAIEKLQVVGPIVEKYHWLQVEAMEKLCQHNKRDRFYAISADLEF